MHPILFQIGPLTIYSYGVMLALAVVVCSWLLSNDAKKFGISRDVVFDFIFWITAGGIIGARIFYILISWDYFSEHLSELLLINRGGLAWQGGFIGGLIAGLWFVKLKNLKMRVMLDLSAPYIALGQAIGRVGCFFNGCCYGKPFEFGLYFPGHSDKIHPTQLYETGMLFIIFLFLKFAKKSTWRPGMVFVLYLCLAGMERFIVEFVRDDHELFLWNLSLAQFIAAGVFVAGLITFVRFKK
jgi:phosphatidylglycerol:prolipoprotein diacylglycerol transferase